MRTLIDIYIDYVNNYITYLGYAEANGIDYEDAKILIEMGKKYHKINTEN